jgi:hypothetical protein
LQPKPRLGHYHSVRVGVCHDVGAADGDKLRGEQPGGFRRDGQRFSGCPCK